MIMTNKTGILTARPANKKVIRLKLVYRTKLNVGGSVNKLNARLIGKGYCQQYGISFITFLYQ